jgi:hypothetical protein
LVQNFMAAVSNSYSCAVADAAMVERARGASEVTAIGRRFDGALALKMFRLGAVGFLCKVCGAACSSGRMAMNPKAFAGMLHPFARQAASPVGHQA